MLAVVVYHAVGAYSTFTPYWPVHDGSSIVADFTRQVFDVFMMPIFFFIAGYFALPPLQRKGIWLFLKSKFKRLGIPWLLAILIVVPMIRYIPVMKDDSQSAIGFWDYWLTYVKGFGRFQIGLLTPERMNQLHYWFLSLLISFFLVFVLLYVVKNKWLGASPRPTTSEPASSKSILRALLLVGVLTSVGYFLTILLIPDMSWATIDLLLQFQPTNLVLYIGYFALGVYAFSRKWFADGEPPGQLAFWVPACVVLTIGFLVVGQDVFANPATSHELSPGLLLVFAFVRSFLCLAVVVVFTSYAIQYWNRPSSLNQTLAAHSYNIYLAHVIFVMPFQDILMVWQGGPLMVKAGIVTLLAILVSIGISKLIRRFPRGFAIGLFGLFVLVAAVTR